MLMPKIRVLLTGLLFSLVLSACGTTTPTPLANGPVNNPTLACRITPPVESVTLNVLMLRSDGRVNEMRKCSEVKNLTVNIKQVTFDQLIEQASAALASPKSPYEIVYAYNGTLVEYASKGWLAPLDDYIEKYKDQYNLGDIPPELWETVSYNGKIYGFPFEQNVQIFFYRKDIFDKYGLKVPKTLDELVEVVKVLAEKKETAYPLALTMGKPSGLASEFNNALAAYGGQWFDNTDRPGFNTREGLKAAELLQTLLKYMPPNALSYTNDDVAVALQQGQIALSNIWITRAAFMDDPQLSKVIGKFEFAVPPLATPGGAPYTNWTQDMFVIPKNAVGNPELAFRFLAESLDRESMIKLAGVGMVTRNSILTDPEIIKKYRWLSVGLATIKAKARILPKKPQMTLTRTILGNNLSDALAGKLTISEALDKASKEVTQEMVAKGLLK